MTMSTATGQDDKGQYDKEEDDHKFVTLFAI